MMKVKIALVKLKIFQEVKNDRLLSLTFDTYFNTLRLYVNEMDKADFGNNKFLFTMPLMHINARMFSEELRTISDKPEGYNISFRLYGAKFEDNKRVPNEKSLTGVIGLKRAKNRDNEIINLITLEHSNGNKANFALLPTPYIDIVIDDKVVTDKNVLTKRWTRSFYNAFEGLLNLFPEGWEEQREKKTY